MRQEWKIKDRLLKFHHKTLIMGVLNVTPDSFSDGGSYPTVASAVERALEMERQRRRYHRYRRRIHPAELYSCRRPRGDRAGAASD